MKKKEGILCLGAVVLDITARPVEASDQWKEKQRIGSISLQVGGDAANQSVHLAALGHPVWLNACIGPDANGEAVRAELTRRGVDTQLLKVRQDTATGTALLLVNEAGERHIFSVKGAHSTLQRSDLPEELPEGCRAVSLGSLFGMPLLEADGLEAFLKKAKQKGILIFADLDSGHVAPGVERVLTLLQYVDYFLPSHYDVLPLTGKKTMEEAVRDLQERGTGAVVVKCGAEGCRVFSSGFQGTIPGLQVKTVDTTGAGDCMTAAFISRILAGDPIEKACRYACVAGSLSTLYPGACGIRLEDGQIRRYMDQAYPDAGNEE